jgi:hypothetical protein
MDADLNVDGLEMKRLGESFDVGRDRMLRRTARRQLGSGGR